MKNVLLYFSFLFLAVQGYAQCDGLFISEYIEGDNHNKALELYNPTDAAIDLNDYRIVRWRNGGNVWTAQQSIDLTGTIGAKSTYVAAKEAGTQQDGSPEVVDPALTAAADGLYCKSYNINNAFYFNGDDALTLEKSIDGYDYEVLDLFGTAVGDPGEGWYDVAPYTTDTFYQAWTREHTMIRKSSVTKGFDEWFDPTCSCMRKITFDPVYGLLLNFPPDFNPSIEWDTLGQNVFDHLGWHESDCDPSIAIKDLNIVPFELYPNPVNDHKVNIESGIAIAEISLFNILGQEADRKQVNGLQSMTYNVPQHLTPGIYLVKVKFSNEEISIKKLIIE